MIFKIMYITLAIVITTINAQVGQDLIEPVSIQLLDNVDYYMAYYKCPISVSNKFTVNGRCFCLCGDDAQDSTCAIEDLECSYPGPTLHVATNSTISLTLKNLWEGDTPTCSVNEYCGLDLANIHTHGLHISANQDDVRVIMTPKTSRKYTYSILDKHYPGTHWYHAHHHGSTSHHVGMGLFGALLVDYPANDTRSYTLQDYRESLLEFSWLFIPETCDCNNFANSWYTNPNCRRVLKNCFFIYSMCFEYCSFSSTERGASDWDSYTDLLPLRTNTNDGYNDQYFLVNGQLHPKVNILQNDWHRLRFINAVTQYYIQYDFSDVDGDCTVYLIGNDGIFFDNEFRDIEPEPHDWIIILPPGGRADLLIQCSTVGEYTIYTSQDDSSGGTASLDRAGSDTTSDYSPYPLFTINVNTATDGDTINSVLPTMPDKPDYLQDLRDADNVETNCPCNTFAPPNAKNWQWTAGQCGWTYNSKGLFLVNGVEWNHNQPYLTSVDYDSVHEFIMFTDRHAHHQHVNPFQVQNDLFLGFFAKGGDFRDTLGAGNTVNWNQRTYHHDFDGHVVLHCHILDHEDKGMMAFYHINPPGINGQCFEGVDSAKPMPKMKYITETDKNNYKLPSKNGHKSHNDHRIRAISHDINDNHDVIDDIDDNNDYVDDINDLTLGDLLNKMSTSSLINFAVLIIVICNTCLICKFVCFNQNKSSNTFKDRKYDQVSPDVL